MKIKFELNYPEISTIHDALNTYLINLKEECEKINKPNLWEESIAFKLYCQFRETIEEIENNKKS